MLTTVSANADFAVNEQCAEFNECDDYDTFLQSKPVFHIEYVDSISSKKMRRGHPAIESAKARRRPSPQAIDSGVLQSRAASASAVTNACTGGGASSLMSTVIKTTDLNGVSQYCDGQVVTTQTTS
jgi:hypothetical protein